MNLRRFAFALAFLPAAVCPLHAAVLITDFGTTEFTITFSDFTSTDQTATNIEIIGTDGVHSIFGNPIPAPIDISGNTEYVALTGTFTGNATSSFEIQLFDTNGEFVTYTFNWSSFTTGIPVTVYAPLTGSIGAFNGLVDIVGLATGGLGDSSVVFVLDRLEASSTIIPEPSAGWLVLFAGLAFFLWKRNKPPARPEAKVVRL